MAAAVLLQFDPSHGEELEADSDFESCPVDGSSDSDPSFEAAAEAAHLRLAKLSLEKKRNRKKNNANNGDDIRVLTIENEDDQKSSEAVQKLVEGGHLDNLKLDQCKVYLRRHGLRLTGTKEILVARIKEHLELIHGAGELKYPVSSFVMNCKGDACKEDVVLFEQDVYEEFNIAYRGSSGPSLGKRTIAGRIVKESYGTKKQQHTFTIEVLWSKGQKPLAALHQLLIKGRNLYKQGTMRQLWADEFERKKILDEKHARGFSARNLREKRIQEKETKKLRIGKLERKNNAKANEECGHKNQDTAIEKDLQRENVPEHHHSAGSRGVFQQQNAQSTREPQLPSRNPYGVEHCMKRHQPREFQANLENQYMWNQPAEAQNMKSDHTKPLKSHNNPYDWHQPSKWCVHQYNDRHAQYGGHYAQGPYRDRYTTGGMPFAQSTNEHRHYSMPQQQRCRYYSQGRCYYGNNCKYWHIAAGTEHKLQGEE